MTLSLHFRGKLITIENLFFMQFKIKTLVLNTSINVFMYFT